MAELIEKTRTNYFRTDDPEALDRLLRSVKTDSGPISIVTDGDTHMFYCTGTIDGVLTEKAKEMLASDPDWADDNPDKAYSHDLFLTKLQALVAPGDACIIRSVGHEAMRDLWANAYIITRSAIKFVFFTDTIRAAAKSMLGDPEWDTVMEG